MNWGDLHVAGDEPDRLRHAWAKPNRREIIWHGRCNRGWRISTEPASPMAGVNGETAMETRRRNPLDGVAHCIEHRRFRASPYAGSPGALAATREFGLSFVVSSIVTGNEIPGNPCSPFLFRRSRHTCCPQQVHFAEGPLFHTPARFGRDRRFQTGNLR